MRIDEINPGDTSLDYVQRVNRALDFILKNLQQPLKLEVVAQAAGFSPFHFHRIFCSLVGEIFSQFVKRLRLERALDWLYKTWLPTSGFVPTDQPGFEAWIGIPFEHGEEHFEIYVQLPVEQG